MMPVDTHADLDDAVCSHEFCAQIRDPDAGVGFGQHSKRQQSGNSCSSDKTIASVPRNLPIAEVANFSGNSLYGCTAE
jgi:hypothetical protein